jgi:hypothetical protein
VFSPKTTPEGYSPVLSLKQIGEDGELRTLAVAAAVEIDKTWPSPTGVSFMASGGESGLYIVDDDGKVVSILIWYPWTEERSAWVGLGWTHPEHRKKGLYKALFDQLHVEVKDLGLEWIACGVRSTNLVSMQAHARVGMQQDSTTFSCAA